MCYDMRRFYSLLINLVVAFYNFSCNILHFLFNGNILMMRSRYIMQIALIMSESQIIYNIIIHIPKGFSHINKQNKYLCYAYTSP